jgi:hypothetical protein
MATAELAVATRARNAVAAQLAGSGITAATDPGAFYPSPLGVLVGLPSLTSRGLATRSYSIPVTVVSGDPLNSLEATDALLALADDVALAIAADTYTPTNWGGGPSSEPLPAIEILATITVTER